MSRLHLRGLERVVAQDLWLIRGELSSAQERKIREGNPSDQARELRIPLAVWGTADERVLAPLSILEAGETYTVAALGVGRVAELVIGEESSSLLYRFGPDEVSPGADIPFCPGRPPSFETALLEPNPPDLAPFPFAKWGLGADAWGSPCLRIRATGEGGALFVPPQRVGEYWIVPDPVRLTPDDPSSEEHSSKRSSDGLLEGVDIGQPAAQCVASACVWAEGAGLGFHVEPGTYAIEVEGESTRDFLVAEYEKASMFVRGPVAPRSHYSITIVRLDSVSGGSDQDGGEPIPESLRLSTGEPSPRFVLNEVLADPTGPEPQAEWIELVNVGTAAGTLEGYSIEDEGARVSLPPVELGAGTWALVVRHDFRPDDGLLPDAAAIPLFVEQLGNGLRNSGERVALVDPDGKVVSSIGKMTAKEGVSVARRSLWSSDEPSSFSLHEPPGASPGAPNTVSR